MYQSHDYKLAQARKFMFLECVVTYQARNGSIRVPRKELKTAYRLCGHLASLRMAKFGTGALLDRRV